MNGGDCKDVPVTVEEDQEFERLCPYPGSWAGYPTLPAWVGWACVDGVPDFGWAMWK